MTEPTPVTPLVRTSVDAGVATIVLDSPHNRNALSRQLVTELSGALAAADVDAEVKVVVLAAEGPAFCSGADLAEAGGEGMEQGSRALVALQRQLLALSVPVLVALHGPVRAGGLGIVAAADVVVASTEVTFAFTEVRLGLAPAVISLSVLPRLTSRQAAYTFLTGDTFDAAAAREMGLVTATAPPRELGALVGHHVGLLRQGSRQGLAETKRLLNEATLVDVDARGEELAARSARLFASDEARAAMRAYLERRRG